MPIHTDTCTHRMVSAIIAFNYFRIVHIFMMRNIDVIICDGWLMFALFVRWLPVAVSIYGDVISLARINFSHVHTYAYARYVQHSRIHTHT